MMAITETHLRRIIVFGKHWMSRLQLTDILTRLLFAMDVIICVRTKAAPMDNCKTNL